VVSIEQVLYIKILGSNKPSGFASGINLADHQQLKSSVPKDNPIQPQTSSTNSFVQVLRCFPTQSSANPQLHLSTPAPCDRLTLLEHSSFQSKLAPFISAGFSLCVRSGSPSNSLEPSLIIIASFRSVVNVIILHFLHRLPTRHIHLYNNLRHYLVHQSLMDT
jgi:hypothetical protein